MPFKVRCRYKKVQYAHIMIDDPLLGVVVVAIFVHIHVHDVCDPGYCCLRHVNEQNFDTQSNNLWSGTHHKLHDDENMIINTIIVNFR